MGHLRPEEFVDLADGSRAEASAPHLRRCAPCRRRLEDARAMMSAASTVEVPEPSPLFWDHVSARIREAVAAEEPHASIGAWWRVSAWPRLALPAAGGAIAAVVVAVMLTSRGLAPVAPDRIVPAAPVERSAAVEPVDDPSLGLVTALAAQMDWDAASAVEGSTHVGAMDEAIGELSAGERVEMKRLLQAELAHPGA